MVSQSSSGGSITRGYVLTWDYRHLMTGTGAYFYIMWGIWLRHCLNGRQEEYDLHWPSIFSLPDVVRTNVGNGDVRKDAERRKLK